MPSDITSTSWAELDANNNQQPPEGWPGGINANAVEPIARMNMGAVKRAWNRANPVYAPTLSTTDSFTVSPSVALAGYGLYEEWHLRFPSANITTSPTIVISSLPAQPIKKYNGAGALVNLAAGDIQAQDHKLWWDATEFILENPAAAAGILTNITLAGTTTLPNGGAITSAGQLFQGTNAAISPNDFAGALAPSTNAIESQTIQNQNTGSSAGVGYFLGNDRSVNDGRIILNSSSNTSLAGSRSVNILANAGRVGIAPMGTLAGYAELDGGLVWGTPSGASQGAGSLNATTLFQNGVAVTPSPFSTKTTYPAFGVPPAATAVSIIHGLGGIPFRVEIALLCNVTDQGYSVGELLPIEMITQSGTVYNFQRDLNSTSITLISGNGGFGVVNKGTGAFSAPIVKSSWSVIVSAVI